MKLIVEQKTKTKIGINQITLGVAVFVSCLGFIFNFAFVIYNGAAKLTAQPIVNNKFLAKQNTTATAAAAINKLDLNRTFIKSEILPLDIQKNIMAFSVSGNVSLGQPKAYARVILIDADDNRYLLYNSDGLNSNSDYLFADACKEACYLNNIKPAALQIQLSDAKITISTIQYLTKS